MAGVVGVGGGRGRGLHPSPSSGNFSIHFGDNTCHYSLKFPLHLLFLIR